MQSPSELRERQQQAGAVFGSEATGASGEDSPPLHFGDPRGEYAAATAGAAVFDWSDHRLIELTGADRVTFLHNFSTNDVKGLRPGRGCEAFVTNVKGRILGHVWIEVGETSIRLDVGPVSPERLIAHLERYIINEDVAVVDAIQSGELLVMGPSAASVVSSVAPEAERVGLLEHVDAEDALGPLRVTRRDVGAQPAYVVTGRRAALGDIWSRLCAAGARPAGSAAWAVLRIEAGLPIYGVDLTDENLAQEAGRTASAISFTKGCYLGQEPIARLDAMGHVNRALRSLRIEGDAVPPPGARVFAEREGTTAVGTITSAASSLGNEGGVALALVRSSVAAPGTPVFVETTAGLLRTNVFWFPDSEMPQSK